MLYMYLFIAVSMVLCVVLLRHRIKWLVERAKSKARDRIVNHIIDGLITGGSGGIASMLTDMARPGKVPELPMEKCDGYILIKSGDHTVYVPFDEDLVYKTVGCIVLLTESLDGKDDKIISPEPGAAFLLSPRDLGFERMAIISGGSVVEEVEGSGMSHKLNLKSWIS